MREHFNKNTQMRISAKHVKTFQTYHNTKKNRKKMFSKRVKRENAKIKHLLLVIIV